jgi:hypothetical protein
MYSFADEKIAAFYKVVDLEVTLDDASNQVKDALIAGGFDILGEYHPAAKDELFVIAYTRNDLQEICLKVEDRGMLAAVFKVGFMVKDGKTQVSILNPEYIFYAYLMEEAENHIQKLKAITSDARQALLKVGSDFTPFGGALEADDLEDYHFMMMMPYFTDPVELNEFSSFAEGLKIIRNNLNAKKGNTIKIYELVNETAEIAVFGIGLLDAEDGEAGFLAVIGESHVAAMPYEIILQGKEATMLHGKYRFALHWPELTMGQFMKISSTPGDVEDFLKALTK